MEYIDCLMEINDLARAVSRKKRLGKAASYRQIAKRTGYSVSTVHGVLKNRESGLDFDREPVLRKIIDALDEIEAEHESEAKAA